MCRANETTTGDGSRAMAAFECTLGPYLPELHALAEILGS